MTKYGVDQQETVEYCVRKVKHGSMSVGEAVKHCTKLGLDMDPDTFNEHLSKG
jgi:hypothetical protein